MSFVHLPKEQPRINKNYIAKKLLDIKRIKNLVKELKINKYKEYTKESGLDDKNDSCSNKIKYLINK